MNTITKTKLKSMRLSKTERANVEEDCETGDYDDQVEAREARGYDDCVIELLEYLEINDEKSI